MPLRPYPTDKPDRETTWRRGRIQTRSAAAGGGFHYIVNFPDLGTELAYSPRRLEINAIVHCQWRNESGLWQIMS